MNTLPPQIPTAPSAFHAFQRKKDQDHLRLLAIFHFICAGLALIGILFVALHFFLFHTFFMNPQMWQNQPNQKIMPPFPPPQAFMGMMIVFYTIFGCWFLLSGILNVISGFCLLRYKCRTFSLVVSGVNCFHMPLGTTLGVFTFVVLLRDSVRELYEEQLTNPPVA